MIFGENGFRVPGVDVRRGALREDVNDVFGPGRKLGVIDARCWPGGLGQQLLGKQSGQTQDTESHSGAGEKLAAGTKDLLRSHPVVAKEIVHRHY